MMRLLIRRYVTAEQRKRDEFGITEDDVMEIRQDISTLRYELIDILRQNGMRTPTIDKQDAARKFQVIVPSIIPVSLVKSKLTREY